MISERFIHIDVHFVEILLKQLLELPLLLQIVLQADPRKISLLLYRGLHAAGRELFRVHERD